MTATVTRLGQQARAGQQTTRCVGVDIM